MTMNHNDNNDNRHDESAVFDGGSDVWETDVNKILRALSGGYERVYYIDAATGSYVKYVVGEGAGGLRLEESGDDFFTRAGKEITAAVYADDCENVRAALKKATLLTHIAEQGYFSMIYRMIENGKPVFYSMRAVRTDERAARIAVGVMNINSPMIVSDVANTKHSLSFNVIAQSLSQDYFCIYYVNMRNNHFVEYASNEEYRMLDLEREGEDFFAATEENIQRVVHPDDAEMMREMLTKKSVVSILKRKHTFTLTYRLMFADGEKYVHLKATRMGNDDPEHVIIGVSDIDEQIRREQEYANLLRTATKDALTGVGNVAAYKEECDGLNAAIAAGTAEPFAVAVCDINDLKNVNDTRGHIAGDECIKKACGVICSVFAHCSVYRVGGDEFAVIIRRPEYDSRHDLAERLKPAARENSVPDREIVACGIAEYIPEKDATVADVFARADDEMYENKKTLKGEE